MNEKTIDSTERQPMAVEQPGTVQRPVAAWTCEASHNHIDLVAQEVAVALVYNGVSHAVMMASPLQLEAFALGFSLTEGIVDSAEDIYAIDVVEQARGIEIALTISSQHFMQLKHRRRSLAGRSGCGICGAQSLQQVQLPLEKIDAKFRISHTAINRATCQLAAHQPLQQSTGAVHGAAWCDGEGSILRVCEDVGRHNALDKLIGILCPASEQQPAAFRQPGFLLISSRASYEIVQKAGKARIAVVVAVSAPTSLAIDIAQGTGITLIGFSRKHRHVAYTHAQRLSQEG